MEYEIKVFSGRNSGLYELKYNPPIPGESGEEFFSFKTGSFEGLVSEIRNQIKYLKSKGERVSVNLMGKLFSQGNAEQIKETREECLERIVRESLESPLMKIRLVD